MSADSLIERIAATLATQAGQDDAAGFVPQAREIVAAMRVPTRAMARAASDIPVGCCMTNASDAGEVWEYMIDAALAERVAASA